MNSTFRQCVERQRGQVGLGANMTAEIVKLVITLFYKYQYLCYPCFHLK